LAITGYHSVGEVSECVEMVSTGLPELPKPSSFENVGKKPKTYVLELNMLYKKSGNMMIIPDGGKQFRIDLRGDSQETSYWKILKLYTEYHIK